jgi:Uma2 family endonuclease
MTELLEIISQLDQVQQEHLLEFAKKILAHEVDIFEEDELQNGEQTSSPYYDVNQLSYTAEDIKAIVRQFPPHKKWTFEDLQNTYLFPAEHFVKIELIDFKIYIMDPNTTHQQLLTNLVTFINMYVLKHKSGRTMVAPVAVKIDEGTVLKPDILYIAIQQIEDKSVEINENGIVGSPSLVVEVLSPSNYKKLRNTKKQKYAQAGVKEYWELRPKKKSITVERLEDGEYQLFSEAKKTGIIQSSVLEGFSLDIKDIFG